MRGSPRLPDHARGRGRLARGRLARARPPPRIRPSALDACRRSSVARPSLAARRQPARGRCHPRPRSPPTRPPPRIRPPALATCAGESPAGGDRRARLRERSPPVRAKAACRIAAPDATPRAHRLLHDGAHAGIMTLACRRRTGRRAGRASADGHAAGRGARFHSRTVVRRASFEGE